MNDIFEAIAGLAPILQSTPVWVRTYLIIWIVAGVGLGVSVALTYNSVPTQRASIASTSLPGTPWPVTGDAQIDAAHSAINSILKTSDTIETQLASALRNVFYKPVFRNITNDTSGSALFTFCRAQLLLQAYVGQFRSPDTRTKLTNSIQGLIALQDQLAVLFGPTLRRDQLCKSTSTFKDYLSSLPPLRQDRLTGGQVDKANDALLVLRSSLRQINLID